MFGFKIITQYERGIVFRWGRALPGIRQPGLNWVNPFSDRLRKVNMQIVVAAVPAQEAITRDNVTLKVDAVVYYRVVDPVKAIINVQDYTFAVSQVAQTSLRSVIGQSDMDQLLSDRDKVNAHLKDVIDAPTEEPWGIRVERVEVKDVSLPESMKRSMSRQAEAERERRARIISADGEYQASKKLAQAAAVMSADPAALQLRLLQTVVEVAAEKNSTLVMPVPVELLRFFDRAAPATGQARPEAAGIEDAPPDTLEVPALEVPALAMPPSLAARPRPERAPQRRAEDTGRRLTADVVIRGSCGTSALVPQEWRCALAVGRRAGRRTPVARRARQRTGPCNCPRSTARCANRKDPCDQGVRAAQHLSAHPVRACDLQRRSARPSPEPGDHVAVVRVLDEPCPGAPRRGGARGRA